MADDKRGKSAWCDRDPPGSTFPEMLYNWPWDWMRVTDGCVVVFRFGMRPAQRPDQILCETSGQYAGALSYKQ